MTRLILVEDHVLVRQSIRAFLQGAGLDVIGEASTGTEAVEMVANHQPDMVIMDVHLPEMSGIEATRHIRQQCPETRVVVLTAYNEKVYQRALIEAGADAFVLKTAEFSELLDIIYRVMSDNTELHPMSLPAARSDTSCPLTERELEVLSCAARGWTNKQIGVHLGISDRTVQVHLQMTYQKLNVMGRTEAVLRGIVLGMISPMDGAVE